MSAPLQSAEIVQALARQIATGKQTRCFVVVLSPVVQLPVELEKLFVCVDHELPDRDQLEPIARGIAIEDGELPAGGRCQCCGLGSKRRPIGFGLTKIARRLD